jgi:hypothetical protein
MEKIDCAIIISISKIAAINLEKHIHLLVNSLQQQITLDRYPTAFIVKGMIFKVAIIMIID